MLSKIAGMVVLAMIFVFLLSTAHAITISAPSEVTIQGNSGSFYVDITNNSSEMQDIKVTFFTPAKSEISAPLSVAPNTTASAKIKLFNTYSSDTTVFSKLEVYMGKEMESKEINVKFVGNTQNSTAGTAGALGAFFSFGAFMQETTNFSLLEWGIFWLLVIVAAVLIIAFVSRVARRA